MTDFSKLARPYAKAAFEFAQQQGALDQWSNSLRVLSQCIAQPEVAQFLKNPRFSNAEREQLCISFVASLDKSGRNFISILAKNNRLMTIPSIADQFEAYRALAEKTLHVRVKSAIPLDADTEQKLNLQLTTKYACHIELETEVDTTLLGGMVIYVGDQVMDSSLQGQLMRLREAMR